MSEHSTTRDAANRTIRIQRSYKATLEDVWELWTTQEGIESWWGPEGFTVTVQKLDLRAGGELLYAMTASAAPQIEFMKRAGMPLTNHSRITFIAVAPPHRLAYTHLVDFVPGVAHYNVNTVVELSAVPTGVQLSLTIDAMHDETWTERAVAGWESELKKLAAKLAR
ncbi:MAG: SRPBCC domain-containing protein [Polyangiaceae bacterium]